METKRVTWYAGVAAPRPEMAPLSKSDQALVAAGHLEIPDPTIIEARFVQTFRHAQQQIRNIVFEQGDDGRWYYTFRGTQTHYEQFRSIMSAYGVRDVEIIRREQEAAAEQAERVRIALEERRVKEDWEADMAVLGKDAVDRFGSSMGGLLAQGLREGIILRSEYRYLVPPLHRRIIHAVRLTLQKIKAYTFDPF